MLFTMLSIAAMAEATDAQFDADFEIIESEPLDESIEDMGLSDYLTDTLETTFGSDIEEDTELQTVADAVYDFEEEELIGDNTVSEESPEVTGMMKAVAAPMAMNKAPDLSEYDNVAVTASMDYCGSPVVAFNVNYIGDYKYLKFGPAVPLTGTATISNTTPRIGGVLNGSLVGGNNSGTLSYVWKASGEEVATGASYTITKADFGKAITVEISSSVETGTITSSSTAAVLKKEAPAATVAPTLASKTSNSVTLAANALYEYSMNGITWQASNVFSGLTASTSYTFYQRIAETDDTESSAASISLSVTTDAGSGGSGGGGGSSSRDDRDSDRGRDSKANTSPAGSSVITITSSAPDSPNAPTQGEIKVKANADEKGNAVVNITGQNVTDVINKVTEAAQRNGNAQNGITMVLNVVTGGKPVSNVTVNLPKVVQDTIIARRIVNTIVVVVDNPNIRISMDLPTVDAINRQAKSDVNVTAARRNNSELTGDARKAIGTRPVFDLKVNYGSGRQVQSFGDGSVWVTIPYNLGENEKAENICAVYIDENGKVHWLTDSVYDNAEKVLRFRTNHFSAYGVGYREEMPAFTDIEGHWAKQDIEFIVSRGLFKGTSETTFSPDMDMTRGMFITVLGRLADADGRYFHRQGRQPVRPAGNSHQSRDIGSTAALYGVAELQ